MHLCNLCSSRHVGCGWDTAAILNCLVFWCFADICAPVTWDTAAILNCFQQKQARELLPQELKFYRLFFTKSPGNIF